MIQLAHLGQLHLVQRLPLFLYALSYLAMRIMGLPLPEQVNVPWLMVPVYLAAFLSATPEKSWAGRDMPLTL